LNETSTSVIWYDERGQKPPSFWIGENFEKADLKLSLIMQELPVSPNSNKDKV
jgi:hypothetical protein